MIAKKNIGKIAAVIAVLLFITNPTVSDFKEHFGHEARNENIRRSCNGILFSIYDFDNMQKSPLRRYHYGEYYYQHVQYTSRYLGIGENFFLLSEKATGRIIHLSDDGEELQ